MREASLASAGSGSSSLLDDAVYQTLGPERPWRVHRCGLGVTPSSLNANCHKSQRETHLEEQLKNLTNVVETMRTEIDRLAQRPVPPMDMPAGFGPTSCEVNLNSLHLILIFFL